MTAPARKKRYRGWRIALAVVGVVALALGIVTASAWRAMGARAGGARLARMQRSPQWQGGRFVNPQPIVNNNSEAFSAMTRRSPHVSPQAPLSFAPVDPAMFKTPPATGVRVTWLGHSTMLVEIDGRRVLTDPVWSHRASPLGWIGPQRWFAPLIALGDLPKIDAVVISHDHYDHLDAGTIAAMKDWDTRFVVPLGVGAHLEAWGVAAAKIIEVDWWERVPLGDSFEIVCTPARHASGRTPFDRDMTLWAGYALVGPRHRVYYSGDTGLFPAMRDIGEKLGPFDLTMIETGQYHHAWPDWHIGPEQALLGNRMVRGRVVLPVHWSLFELASHAWTEPVERALVAAARLRARIVAPRPGQSFEPATAGAPPEAVTRWWPSVPWQTAAEEPIISSGMN